MTRWNEETIMKFVNLYESQTCLWQTTHENYKSKMARNYSLMIIVKAMNLDGFGVSECKMKIKNLRSHYCQELNKIRNGDRNGTVYRPTIVWFSRLDGFLRSYTVQSNDAFPKKSLEIKTEDDLFSVDDEEIEGTFSEGSHEIETVMVRGTVSPYPASPAFNHTLPKRRKTNVEHDVQQPIVIDRRELTEFDVWAKSVAIQLNKMEVGRALRLQLKIQMLVSEERINYDAAGNNGCHYQAT